MKQSASVGYSFDEFLPNLVGKLTVMMSPTLKLKPTLKQRVIAAYVSTLFGVWA
jgi:hypothetical protein